MTQPGILGNRAEKLALNYLQKQGLRFHQKNYHCRYGEIDLILWHQEYLVFVEVRYRKNQQFGGALESVDQHKQRKLNLSAQCYLMQHKKLNDIPCRFDILCMNGDLKAPHYLWIKNAF